MGPTIGFDATAAARQGAGIGRYTRELLGALARRNDSYRYAVYYCGGGDTHGWLPSLDGRFNLRRLPLSDRVLNAVWHRARLPLPVQFLVGSIDLFHSPDFTLPPVPGKPAVLTVHDLAFLTVPDCAYPTLRRYLERVVPRSVARADHVIAVSESTRQDLIRLLHVPPHKVTTVHEGVVERFRPVADRHNAMRGLAPLGIAEPYLLSVGTLEPRKNYARLFEAYALLRSQGVTHTLVIAGRPGWLYEPALQRLRELHLEPHVRLIQPSEDQLPALYAAADGYVAASLYEGFGIPALEALASGAPVAAGNTSSLPEVVGNAAILFDPYDVEDIARAIARILLEGEVATRLRAAGPTQASKFTWSGAAEGTVAVYREVLKRA